MDQTFARRLWAETRLKTLGVDCDGEVVDELTPLGAVVDAIAGSPFTGGTKEQHEDHWAKVARALRKWADALEGRR